MILFATITIHSKLMPTRLLLLGVILISTIGCSPEYDLKDSSSTSQNSSRGSSLANTSQVSLPVRAELPSPRDQSFVGSEACRECHSQIAEQYAKHPMGMSMARVADMKLIERPNPDWLDIAGPDKYRVELELDSRNRPTQLIHQQLHLDGEGKELGNIREAIAFTIGSGQKGRAYIAEKERMLFQSPLGWYTGKSCWDLSPGYSPERHPGFQRRIDASCLYCHAGRMAPEKDHQYSAQIFHEIAIGCERCHGPGEKHIQFHRLQKNDATADPLTSKAQDPICNPTQLSPQAREDVCNQCHLQAEQVIPRFGRDFFDFRPGDRLEDVFVIFSSTSRQGSRGNFRAVSHVEQMRESRCYQAVPQAMGCTSCHDPHQNPSPQNRVEHYRQSCLKCHQEQGCSISLSKRQAKNADSCIACHMPRNDISNVPHTVQTDHRILRSPRLPAAHTNTKAWAVIDGAQERLPDWEIARARGLAMMTVALQKRDSAMAIKAREYLQPSGTDPSDFSTIIARLANDPESLSAIASSFWLEGQYANARPFWKKTLESSPHHETALSGLIQIELDANDLKSAELYGKKLTESAPAEASHWVQLSTIQWKLQQNQSAIESAQKALSLDPNLDQTRDWILKAQRKLQVDSAPDSL